MNTKSSKVTPVKRFSAVENTTNLDDIIGQQIAKEEVLKISS